VTHTFQVVFDSADPDRLAHFWADVLGYKIQDPPAGFATWQDFLRSQNIPQEDWNSASAIVDPEGRGPRIYIQRVPEGKTVKNRLHLDINISGGPSSPLDERRQRVDADVERVRGLGATVVRTVEQRGEYWTVLQDIEGNEFCIH
jgi:hypothetical protein